MVKRIAVYAGIVGFVVVGLVGFVNHLNWFTIFIRAFMAFAVTYGCVSLLGFIGLQSLLHQELVKRKRLAQELAEANQDAQKKNK